MIKFKVIIKKVHGLEITMPDNVVNGELPDNTPLNQIVNEAKAQAALWALNRFIGCVELDAELTIYEKVVIKQYAGSEGVRHEKG